MTRYETGMTRYGTGMSSIGQVWERYDNVRDS